MGSKPTGGNTAHVWDTNLKDITAHTDVDIGSRQYEKVVEMGGERERKGNGGRKGEERK